MPEPSPSGPSDPAIGELAARAIEVLVTHNEPVSRDDLACALGVSEAQAWAIATALETLGYAQLNDRQASVEATPRASDPATRAIEAKLSLDLSSNSRQPLTVPQRRRFLADMMRCGHGCDSIPVSPS